MEFRKRVLRSPPRSFREIRICKSSFLEYSVSDLTEGKG